MTEEEIKELWESEKEVYRAWGAFVCKKITERLDVLLLEKNIDPKGFLLIEPTPRIKDDNSLIDKAFYRGKKYLSPYEKIEDKVGLRFIVLLTEHISFIEQALKTQQWWYARKDVDFRKQRMKSPERFGYESVHYIVVSKKELEGLNKERIPKQIACEVQIRSMLQHACSELTHNTTYKFKRKPSPDTMRVVAKTSALLETTDQLFLEVAKQVTQATAKESQVLAELEKLYVTLIGQKAVSQASSQIILDSIIDLIEGNYLDRIQALFINKKTLINKIRDRSVSNGLNRQPVILALYLLAWESSIMLKSVWPLPDDELRLVYEDMGISFERQ